MLFFKTYSSRYRSSRGLRGRSPRFVPKGYLFIGVLGPTAEPKLSLWKFIGFRLLKELDNIAVFVQPSAGPLKIIDTTMVEKRAKQDSNPHL